MAKRGTRRGTRRNGNGVVKRVAAPVGAVVNVGAKIVENVFHGAKKIGTHVVNGANKIAKSVGKSFRGKKHGGGRRRKAKATRRRKN